MDSRMKNSIMIIDEYLSTDYKNIDQIASMICDICRVKEDVDININKVIVRKLKSEGYRAWDNTEDFYMDKYNNLEQCFMLNDNKKILSDSLVKHYIGSIDRLQTVSNYVHYLSNIYYDRFIDNSISDKYELIKKRKSYDAFLKENR